MTVCVQYCTHSRMKDEGCGKYCQICVPYTVEAQSKNTFEVQQLAVAQQKASKVASFQGATDIVTHNEGSKLVLFLKGYKNWGHTI